MARLNHTPALDRTAQRYDEAFPVEFLEATAHQTGLVERARKLDPVLLFWTLALRCGIHLQTSMAAIERGYNHAAEQAMSHAAFYERFTPELVAFLKACVERGIEYLASLQGFRLDKRLGNLKDILIQDSTIIRLHEKLHRLWPATRSRKVAAGVKLGTLVSIVSAGPKRVEIFPERTSETKTLRLGPWVKDRLLLFDLGFYKHQAFARIRELGGSFVSRLKDSADPFIVRRLNTVRGNSIQVEGLHLHEVLHRLKRQVLDVVVELEVKRRTYRGKVSREVQEFRVIAILNEETKKYHSYVTNLAAADFSAEEVASLYRARWEIELLFKEMKSNFHLDEIPTANRNAAEAIIWTGVLATLMHRVFFVSLCQQYPGEVLSAKGSAVSFCERVGFLLYVEVLGIQGRQWDLIVEERVLASGAFNPYRERRAHLQEWLA